MPHLEGFHSAQLASGRPELTSKRRSRESKLRIRGRLQLGIGVELHRGNVAVDTLLRSGPRLGPRIAAIAGNWRRPIGPTVGRGARVQSGRYSDRIRELRHLCSSQSSRYTSVRQQKAFQLKICPCSLHRSFLIFGRLRGWLCETFRPAVQCSKRAHHDLEGTFTLGH